MSTTEQLDPRIERWFALQMIEDDRASWLDAGNDEQTKTSLAAMACTATVKWTSRDEKPENTRSKASVPVLRLLAERGAELWNSTTEESERIALSVLLAGPGMGKTTTTVLLAQLLRVQWTSDVTFDSGQEARKQHLEVRTALNQLREREQCASLPPVLPLRVLLPRYLQWAEMQSTDNDAEGIWSYLAHQISKSAGSIDSDALRSALSSTKAKLYWIWDALDEVPHALRARAVALVDTCGAAIETLASIVSVRTSAYEGTWRTADELALLELSQERAAEFVDRMLVALIAGSEQLEDARGQFGSARQYPEVQTLLTTPLHASMVASLLASGREVPRSPWTLFEDYTNKVFDREDRKKLQAFRKRTALDSTQTREVLWLLHERVGLALHVRLQFREDATPHLTERRLKILLDELLKDVGLEARELEEASTEVLRVANERLGLLLRVPGVGYLFHLRSLQEFFAAGALLRGSDEQVERRVETFALHRHWENVLRLLASKLFGDVREKPRAQRVLLGLCKRLDSGECGRAAAGMRAGTRFAVVLWRATTGIALKWAVNELAEIALDGFVLPSLNAFGALHRWLGAAENTDEIRTQCEAALEQRLYARIERAVRDVWNARGIETAIEELWLIQGRSGGLHSLREELARAGIQSRVSSRLLLSLALADPQEIEPLTAYLRRGPAQFSPADFSYEWFFGYRFDYEREASWLWQVRAWEREASLLRTLASGREEWFHYTIRRLKQTKPLPTNAEALSGESWAELQALREFERVPSLKTLERFVASIRFPRVEFIQQGSWVASAVWEWCVDDLRRSQCEVLVRSGTLGDVQDWIAAEERWLRTPALALSDWCAWLTSPVPWSDRIATEGEVLSNGMRSTFEVRVPAAWLREGARALLSVNGGGIPKVREFRNLCTFTNSWPEPVSVDLYQLRSFHKAMLPTDSFPLWLVSLPTNLSRAWIEILDQIGNERGFDVPAEVKSDPRFSSLAGALVDAINEHPSAIGLWSALLASLRAAPSLSLDLLRLPAFDASWSRATKAQWTSIALLSGRLDTPMLSEALDEMHCTADNPLSELYQAIALLPRTLSDAERRLDVCDALVPRGWSYLHRQALHQSYARELDASLKTPFATEEEWKRHTLPGAFPLAGLPPADPVFIEELLIENVRAFAGENRFTFRSTPAREQGQWILLVGENGSGKTTLLRALALALAPHDVATTLIQKAAGPPLRRNGHEARVGVRLKNAHFEHQITRKGFLERVLEGECEGERPWVVAYGVRRGMFAGDAVYTPVTDLQSLFDQTSEATPALTNSKKWLMSLEAEVNRERSRAARAGSTQEQGPREREWSVIQNEVCDLLELLPDSFVVEPDPNTEGTPSELFVTHKRFGRVRFDSLSDGYLTFAGWVVDLIARWIGLQNSLERELPAKFTRRMTGVVLIDELDLHLHPVWQIDVVSKLRTVFPRMTFVATTHNPLLLQSARKSEVFVVRRENDRIVVEPHEITPGSSVERVLFDQFGVLDTHDETTRTLLKEYRTLLSVSEDKRDKERLATVSKELTDLLGLSVMQAHRLEVERTKPFEPLPDDEIDDSIALLKARKNS